MPQMGQGPGSDSCTSGSMGRASRRFLDGGIEAAPAPACVLAATGPEISPRRIYRRRNRFCHSSLFWRQLGLEQPSCRKRDRFPMVYKASGRCEIFRRRKDCRRNTAYHRGLSRRHSPEQPACRKPDLYRTRLRQLRHRHLACLNSLYCIPYRRKMHPEGEKTQPAPIHNRMAITVDSDSVAVSGCHPL